MEEGGRAHIDGAAARAVLVAWVTTASSAVPGGTTIEVFQPERGFAKFVDVGKPGFGPGDEELESQPLLDPGDRSKVGRAVLRLKIVKPLPNDDAIFIVDGTWSLADGSLTAYGSAKFSDLEAGGTFVVTGGTGAYEQARGSVTVTLTQMGGTEGATLAFHVFTA